MWIKINVLILVDFILLVLYGFYFYISQDIWISMILDGVCFVYFDFYNGVMSIIQCQCLIFVLCKVEEDDFCKVIVFMGGSDMFSNGIYLNVIEVL